MSSHNLIASIEISKNNSQLLPFISEITPDDKQLLEETVKRFRPNSKNYEDSWGYIIQSTRNDGFKWHDPHRGSLIFFGRKSATDKTLVVPSFFAEPEYLTYIVARVQEALQRENTILKNVSHEDVIALMSFGFRRYLKEENWSPEARFDDQTYPQLVVDLKLLKNHFGKIYQNLRTVLNKKTHLRIRKYTEKDSPWVYKIFDLIDEKYSSPKKPSKRDYYISHAMYPAADIDKYVIVSGEDDEIVGFTATSKISSISTALVAALFKPHMGSTSVWGIYQTLISAYDQGYQLINLGGCETKGTHNFMRRTFRPIEQLGKTHLIYSGNSQ